MGREARVNDLIQFTNNHKWAGCVATVQEVRPWGLQAYVSIPNGGDAFIRVTHGDYVVVGTAYYIVEDEDD